MQDLRQLINYNFKTLTDGQAQTSAKNQERLKTIGQNWITVSTLGETWSWIKNEMFERISATKEREAKLKKVAQNLK